ncbi:response regulator [Cytophaga hutchinsonii]|uniref:Response regulator of Zn/Pb responsive two-component regulatory system n=1 Tax=Cytophaga hutchinsonii (strain ATCC 33406 / DSM 1761 / CIP 103989 / NBRC 15051 / NCIMB 9469 / D465) TaxID=269798 RepID=A0A6N4SUX2_CYTH3|nr:response regulator [Cytophaga hutchinsonii]ABG60128.1 response regulator of Zn/Pb responsive two-component regulatory system [Cytophaga hutchinsonii ATCC 33406]SFX23608.1 Response regulator receiver domain-containing protein [Cytophaga hutchinsonii ATCC 33406]
MRKYINPRVFVVEDNTTYAQMIGYQLEQKRNTVDIFHSGEECLNQLYKNPDIIVLDYMLGTMDGIEVLKQVKSINPDIQVIFLSAQDDIQVGINSLKYGAFDYVIKDDDAHLNVSLAITKILMLKSMVITETKRSKLKRFAIASLFVLVAFTAFKLIF